MKPCVIVVIADSDSELHEAAQELINADVYVTLEPLYLMYMDLYRLEHGNVDHAISMPELESKIQSASVGNVIYLCGQRYRGQGRAAAFCKVLRMK